MKKIRILFEIPEDWVDYQDPLLGLGSFIHGRFDRMLKEAVVNKAVSQMKMPKIEITDEELRGKILELMAERALKIMRVEDE